LGGYTVATGRIPGNLWAVHGAGQETGCASPAPPEAWRGSQGPLSRAASPAKGGAGLRISTRRLPEGGATGSGVGFPSDAPIC